MSLFPPSGAPWGIAGSFDHDTPGIAPRRSALLVETLLQVEGTPAHARLLAAAGVQRVVAFHARGLESLPLVAEVDALLPEPVRVRSVEGALPRAYAVGRAIVARGDADALRVLLDPAFDPTAAVVLAEAPEAPTDGPAPRATVRVDHIGADRVRLDADLDAPGYVVLADAWAPGWTARVGGRDAPVLRANVGLRAVPVPAGRHTVELRYRAPGLAAGLALSGAALVVGAAAALRSKRGRPGAAAIP
jgi:hypothetical protein